jgi:hypothetical protein
MSILEPAQVLAQASVTMSYFKSAFGQDLSRESIAVSYVVETFALELSPSHQKGYEAISSDGDRYRIIHRLPQTQNIVMHDLAFDYVVLVNLSDAYLPLGMWRITHAQAQEIFIERPDHHRYQATQKQFKRIGEFVPADNGNVLTPDDILNLAAGVYEGLSQQEIEDVEQIALDRRSFFGDQRNSPESLY